MFFLRRKYKEKPKQWGPFPAVQAGLFHTAEKIGINPADIALAMPMWEPGSQWDYSKNGLIGANYSVTHTGGGLLFNGSSSYISFSTPITTDPITIVSLIKPTSFAAAQCVCSISNTSLGGEQHGMIVCDMPTYGAGDDLSVFSRDPSFKSGTATTPLVLNELATVSGVWASTTSRTAAINGNYAGENTDSVDPISLDTLDIGRLGDSTPNWYFSGFIYNTLAFSSILSADKIHNLSNNPYQLWQPYSPPVYFDLAAGGDSGLLPILFNHHVTKNIGT